MCSPDSSMKSLPSWSPHWIDTQFIHGQPEDMPCKAWRLITSVEFCYETTVSDVIKCDYLIHEYNAYTFILVKSIILRLSWRDSHLLRKVIIWMLPCRWAVCSTLNAQSGTQLFIFPAALHTTASLWILSSWRFRVSRSLHHVETSCMYATHSLPK